MTPLSKNSSNTTHKYIKHRKSTTWTSIEHRNALSLFHAAAKRVPAYKDFLRKNKISPLKIRNYKDLQIVPPISKKNYLRKYPLNALLWDGNLNTPLVFTSTSGSTGKPFYFPRSNDLDWQYSVMLEQFLHRKKSSAKQKRTLIIIGFGMGVWIGGLISYKAFEIVSMRQQLPLSIITPGINKEEIFKALQNIAPFYEEIILVGYPPFIKDIIDEAPSRQIQINKMNLRVITAAEAFTENFRDHIGKIGGIKNVFLDTSNIYGSADIGAMALETPVCILIRKLAYKNRKLFKNIFSSIIKTPTLAQYNPFFISFDTTEKSLLITGNNSIPLIRYSIGDHGGVYHFNELARIFNLRGIDIYSIARQHSIERSNISEMPFVYVFERDDFSTTLYGLQIFPETIREVLLEKPFTRSLTGKFTLITKYDKKLSQYLEINLELKKNIKSFRNRNQLLFRITKNLLVRNAEFKELIKHLGAKRRLIVLKFWPNAHPLYFKTGIKQRWVIK